MKIDTRDYLSYSKAIEALGMDKTSFSRAIRRAGRDEVTATFWGHRVIRRDKLKEIEACYFKRGTERASLAAKHFGHLGGSQKAINARQRAAGSGRGGRADAG